MRYAYYTLQNLYPNVPESNCFAYLLFVWWARCTHPIFGFDFGFSYPERRRVAQAGQGIMTNMFEHVDAQRIMRVYEEA